MKNNLNLLIFLTLATLIFSIPKNIQGVDSFSEDLEKKTSVSSRLFHFGRGAENTMNQEIIKDNQAQLLAPGEYGNLPETANLCNKVMPFSEKSSLKVSNTHLVLPLIEDSARLIKWVVSYTIEHPIQALFIGLASQVGCVEAVWWADPSWWKWFGIWTGVGIASCCCLVICGSVISGRNNSRSSYTTPPSRPQPQKSEEWVAMPKRDLEKLLGRELAV